MQINFNENKVIEMLSPTELIFNIEALSPKDLCAAKKLQMNVFPYTHDKEKLLLDASLNKRKYLDIYKDNELNDIKYWILKDTQNNIIGLTGIYSEQDDDIDMCWLGWFCIDESYRGQGYAKKLLNFSIDIAKKMKKQYLHLYTYDSKEYNHAVNMYEQYNFIRYDVKKKKYKKDLYFKKMLKGL